jgi:hypothetical protein
MQGFSGRSTSPVFCLVNSAIIRRDMPLAVDGSVTVAGVEEMLPPEEGVSMAIVEITPAALQLALENSVSAQATWLGEVPDGRFLHIAGGLSVRSCICDDHASPHPPAHACIASVPHTCSKLSGQERAHACAVCLDLWAPNPVRVASSHCIQGQYPRLFSSGALNACFPVKVRF